MKKRIIALILALVLTLAACATADRPLTAQELLDLGEKYLLEQDYEQALVQFTKLIELEPMNPRGYTGAAEAYVGLGNTERAVKILQQGQGQINSLSITKMLDDILSQIENGTPTPEASQPAFDGNVSTPQVEQTEELQPSGANHVPQPLDGYPKTERRDFDASDNEDAAAYVITEYNQYGNRINATYYNRSDAATQMNEYFYDMSQNCIQEICIHYTSLGRLTTEEKFFDLSGREIKNIHLGSYGQIETVTYDYTDGDIVRLNISSTAYETDTGIAFSGYEETVFYQMQFASADNFIILNRRATSGSKLRLYSVVEYADGNWIETEYEID